MGCGFKIILPLLAGWQRCWTPRSSPGCRDAQPRTAEGAGGSLPAGTNRKRR